MTTKQAREGVVARLTPKLRELGFAYSKARSSFERRAGDYLHIFDVAAISVAPAAELRPFVSLRADRIENLLSRAAADNSPAARHGATLGRELGAIDGNAGQWRMEVRTEVDLDSAAALAVNALVGPAEAFYTRYSDLAMIDEHLNTQPDQPAALAKAHLHRAEAGIVVARLLQRQDIPELIEGYHRFLRRIHAPDVTRFDNFVSNLDAAFLELYPVAEPGRAH